MNPQIRLTRFVSDPAVIAETDRRVWTLKAKAEGTGIPSEIFVYHVDQQSVPIAGDKFECVATVNQIYELPVDQGVILTETRTIPYYRSSEFQVVLRSAEEAEIVWQQLQQQLQQLD